MQSHSYVTVLLIESTVDAPDGFDHVPGAIELANAVGELISERTHAMTVERAGKGTAIVEYSVTRVANTRASREPS